MFRVRREVDWQTCRGEADQTPRAAISKLQVVRSLRHREESDRRTPARTANGEGLDARQSVRADGRGLAAYSDGRSRRLKRDGTNAGSSR